MTRALAATVLAALAAALPPPADAADPGGGVELLRDFTVALPPSGRAVARLRVPPVSEAVLDRLGPTAPLFTVGEKGAVWIGVEPGVLIQATQGYRLRPAVPLADVAALGGGGLAVATDDALGYLVPEGAPGTAGAVTFQPVVELPVAPPRLAAGTDGSLYAFGPARGGEGHALYLLAPEDAGTPRRRALRTLRKVFSGPERIAAVAGDGADTYLAVGRLILKVTGATRALSPVLLHPREPITGLALTRRGLLFYSTASGVGVAAPGGTVEFVKAPGVVLRASGDSLWILLRGSLAVVEIDGTESFRLSARTIEHRK